MRLNEGVLQFVTSIHEGCAFLVISGTRYPKFEIFGYPVTRKQFCKNTYLILLNVHMYKITNMNKIFSCFIRVMISVDLL